MAQRIDFKKNPTVIYLDTYTVPEHEDVCDWWNNVHELDDEPADAPVENSSDWWDAVSHMREDDWHFLADNLPYAKLGTCLVSGTVGTWRGNMAGGRVLDVSTIYDLLSCVNGCDSVKVYVDCDGLQVEGYHHDGTNHFTVRPLTKKGVAYWERHCEQSQRVHEHLRDTKGYCRKVSEYLF